MEDYRFNEGLLDFHSTDTKLHQQIDHILDPAKNNQIKEMLTQKGVELKQQSPEICGKMYSMSARNECVVQS